MSRLVVRCFSISLDGYGAGPNQGLENPLGVGGESLHDWFVPTRTFKQMHGAGNQGETGVDDDFAARIDMAKAGAWIMGRNMFGPVRGTWPDESWKGWWGDDPPYHTPVFVLTHHPRKSLAMAGGTTFHFVTDGIRAALTRATEAANGRDIIVGGGAATVRQYLRERLIDDVHIAISPILLGSGEHLLTGIDLVALGYRVAEVVPGEKATHVVVAKSG